MKKYLECVWMRMLAALLCTVSVLGLCVSLFPTLFFWTSNQSETYKTGKDKIASNYALYIYDEWMAGRTDELAEFLSETNMDAAIVKVENSLGAEVPEEEKTSMLYSFSQVEVNIDEIEERTEVATNPEFDMEAEEINLSKAYMLEIYDGSAYTYNIDSIFGAMKADVYFSEDSNMIPSTITGFSYDVNTGIFYYETPLGCYEVTYIYVYEDDMSGTCDYRLVNEGTRKYYYNDYYNRELDITNYQKWEFVQIDGVRLYLDNRGAYENQSISVIEDSQVITERLRDDYYYTSDMMLYYSNVDEIDKYQIYIEANEPFEKADLFQEWHDFVNDMVAMDAIAPGLLIVFGLLFVFALVVLVYAAPNNIERLGFFHKLPVFSYTLCIVLCEGLALAGLMVLTEDWYFGSFQIPFHINLTLTVILAFVALFVGFLWLANMIARFKCKSFWRYSEFYYIYSPFSKIWKMAQDNMPLFWKGIVLLSAISIVEFIVLSINMWDGDVLIAWFFFGKLIEIPLVIFVLLQMKELQNGSKRIADGDLSQAIDTSKLRWEFKKHGENLNSVSDSISLAVDEQLKSERFKTELITNVSHDIKTPLTSIINYVDLLKKEDLTDETVREYVDVLDRQSARLKKLIEDLMEASKASTGNLPVQLEECDIEVLLTQIIGEFEDKLAANELELIVDKPETPVKIKADGKHMWRVLDNLMNNACKYAQPHTRVYVSLTQEGQTATITFRNISKAALNIPSDELMERFVRGDSSRNTEGSGLGLSIAQSLTELMNGSMKLDIDGDLFKVTLKFHIL